MSDWRERWGKPESHPVRLCCLAIPMLLCVAAFVADRVNDGREQLILVVPFLLAFSAYCGYRATGVAGPAWLRTFVSVLALGPPFLLVVMGAGALLARVFV